MAAIESKVSGGPLAKSQAGGLPIQPPAEIGSAAYLASIVEASEEAIVATSLDGVAFIWNAGAERLYGYKREAVIGRSIALIVPPDRDDELGWIFDAVRCGRRVDHFDTIRLRKGGRRIHVSLTVAPIVDADGTVRGATEIARDITDQTRAQGLQREALARLRAVVNTAVDGIITIDECGTIETANPAALKMFGYKLDELVGQNVRTLMPEPYRSEHDAYVARYLNTGERKIIGIGREARGRRKNGVEFPLELAVSETCLEHRRIFTGVVRDISRRRAAEETLRTSEARFRSVADSAPHLIWIGGAENGRTWFNRRWLEFTGRSMRQEVSDGWIAGIHRQDLDRYLAAYGEALHARRPFELEFRLLRADGAYRWVQDAAVPLVDGRGAFAGYIGSCVDITDRKQDEDALLERIAQRTRELRTANAQLEQQIRERQRIESLLACENRVLELLATGASPQDQLETICKAVSSLIPSSHCAVRLMPAEGERTTPSEADDSPTMGVDLFGEIATAGIFPAFSRERVVVARVPAAQRADDPFQQQRIRSYWMEPIMAPGGTPVGMLGVYRTKVGRPDDRMLSATIMAARLAGIVTDRSRAEERARQQLAQLAHVARLATMGEMASGLAHELNQPLCAIVNFTEACVELVKQNGHDRQQLPRALSEVARQAERAGGVIRRLREFVRRKVPERQPADINAIIREVVAFTSTDARRREVRVRTKLAKRPPRVFADSIQIEQVLVNLIRNACDAMDGLASTARVLTIETIRHRGAVEVAVSDRGPGIPEDQREQLFEPFFTTKRDGMGMGLSISRSILELHEGRIWVTSNRKGGSTFRFTLPTAWRVRRDRGYRVRRRR